MWVFTMLQLWQQCCKQMDSEPIFVAVAAASRKSNAATVALYERFHLIVAKKAVAATTPCERTFRPRSHTVR